MDLARLDRRPQGSINRFDTTHLLPDLKARSIRGGAVTLGAQSVKFLLQMVSTVLLARLLAPEDFGLFAMAMVAVNFVAVLNDAGFSMATVQRESLTDQQVSALFWIGLAVSIVLTCATAGLAPVVAWFYEEPKLTWVILAIAPNFVIAGSGFQHQALLRRQMQFKHLAGIEIGSQFAGIISGIGIALLTKSYWALVAIPLVASAANTIGAWMASGWSPIPLKRGSGVMPLVAMGGNITGFSFLNYFARNADNLLIGWWWGAASLGIYSRAYALLMLPLNQLRGPFGSVAMPLLSRLQNHPRLYRRAFALIQDALTMLALPLISFLFSTADWVIPLVLGDQWLEAVEVFQWLAIAGFCQMILAANGWVFVTQDRSRDMLIWGAISAPLTVASFLVGLPWGITGVAASYAISEVLVRTPLLMWWAGRRGRIRGPDFIRFARRGLTMAALVGLVSLSPRLLEVSDLAVNLVLAGSLSVMAVGILLCFPSCRPLYFASRSSHR